MPYSAGSSTRSGLLALVPSDGSISPRARKRLPSGRASSLPAAFSSPPEPLTAQQPVYRPAVSS